ncbi:MAG: SIS domain-containing protein, partial [bacterium]|nr:SIS domain-containing protein [bacterium]
MIQDNFSEALTVHKAALSDKALLAGAQKVAEVIADTFRRGGKVLIAGNGGSAADSQHFAGELVGYFKDHERRGYPVIALSTDTSILTAWSNDRSFDEVFARQVGAHGKKGDVFIGLSTSGNSKNIIAAFEQAKKNGLVTVSWLGGTGGKKKGMTDIELIVPSAKT